MENLVEYRNPDISFWKDKRVLITGHTGFKGAWLTYWLLILGARVVGYSLPPHTKPSLFKLLNLNRRVVKSILSDVRNLVSLHDVFKTHSPEIVFHLAAQPIVYEGYRNPVETFDVNVMGTVNVHEAVRKNSAVKVMINVTTDKVYRNEGWYWGYRESDKLEAFDPYSASKVASETVTKAYSRIVNARVATVRTGNVIGGGDWADKRIIPDIIKAYISKSPLVIRCPNAIRPWQHVLEPLCGYILLAEDMFREKVETGESYNFGPDLYDCISVGELTNRVVKNLPTDMIVKFENKNLVSEVQILRLDSSKAKSVLHWYSRWNIDEALIKTISWYVNVLNGHRVELDMDANIEMYISHGH